MMTPSLFFLTKVEFGVPAFLRVVWYGVDLYEACAPPAKRTSGPRATRPTIESARQRLVRGDVTPFPTSARTGPSTARSIRRRRSASSNSRPGTWTTHRGHLRSRAYGRAGRTWRPDPVSRADRGDRW